MKASFGCTAKTLTQIYGSGGFTRLQPRQPERAIDCFLEFIYNTFSLLECSANLPSQGFDALLGIAELLLQKMLVNLKLRNCSISGSYLTGGRVNITVVKIKIILKFKSFENF